MVNISDIGKSCIRPHHHLENWWFLSRSTKCYILIAWSGIVVISILVWTSSEATILLRMSPPSGIARWILLFVKVLRQVF